MIDFPTPGGIGATFAAPNGVTYQWNGTLWVSISAGGAPITVSDTAPASPTAGLLWWSSVLGTLLLYYNDGNSSQWVPAVPTTPGTVLQTAAFETGAVATGSTIMPGDDTIPQITEGDQYMSLSITPKSATSKLIIEVLWNGAMSVQNTACLALFQDSTANALAATCLFYFGAVNMMMSLRHVMTSGTTSATTFRVRAGPAAAATLSFNGYLGNRILGGVYASSIVITETAQ